MKSAFKTFGQLVDSLVRVPGRFEDQENCTTDVELAVVYDQGLRSLWIAEHRFGELDVYEGSTLRLEGGRVVAFTYDPSGAQWFAFSGHDLLPREATSW